MKSIKLYATALLIIAMSAFASPNIWTADVAHSGLNFVINHYGINDIHGCFRDYRASLTSESDDFSDALIQAEIQTRSIDTRVDARNKHLLASEYFDAENYPVITFKSTKVSPAGKNTFKVDAQLTVKGITKNVNATLIHRGQTEHPRSKKIIQAYQLKTVIKRSDFDIASHMPNAVVGDEVEVVFNGEFSK